MGPILNQRVITYLDVETDAKEQLGPTTGFVAPPTGFVNHLPNRTNPLLSKFLSEIN